MKPWLVALVATPWVATVFTPSSTPTTIVIGGEFNGYLSPCGCSEPMLGGLERLGGLVASTRQAGKTLVFLSGPITSSLGRQSELKAETVAEAVRVVGASGFNLTSQDSRLGLGTVSSMQNLSRDKLLWGRKGRVAGAFWVAGASQKQGEIAANLDEEPGNLGDSLAQSGGRPVIVLLEGDLAYARQIATQYKQVRLIVFTAPGKAPAAPVKEGAAWLVHPGERGTAAIRLTWQGGRWISYQAVPLGPDTTTDQGVRKVFHEYLNRVDEEDLLEQMPRSSGPEYAGSQICMSCHAKAAKKWQESKHAVALATLEGEHHDRDPDCISCHVVDIQTQNGFRTRTETPDLADVGCESCHGPGLAHTNLPKANKMPKFANDSCTKCHTVNNSPRFEFDSYWKKIAH